MVGHHEKTSINKWLFRVPGIFILYFVYTPPKTNMTMENPPFEDVFPIEDADFPLSC